MSDALVREARKVLAGKAGRLEDEELEYLKIENREIYLWSNYTNKPLYYYPWPDPYYRRPYPYWYW